MKTHRFDVGQIVRFGLEPRALGVVTVIYRFSLGINRYTVVDYQGTVHSLREDWLVHTSPVEQEYFQCLVGGACVPASKGQYIIVGANINRTFLHTIADAVQYTKTCWTKSSPPSYLKGVKRKMYICKVEKVVTEGGWEQTPPKVEDF